MRSVTSRSQVYIKKEQSKWEVFAALLICIKILSSEDDSKKKNGTCFYDL